MVTQRARAALAAVLTAGLSLASVRPVAAPPGRSSADFAEAARIGDLLAAWRFPEAAERARALVTAAERSDGADSLAAAEALDLLVKALVGSWAVRDGQALALAGRALAIKEARLPADDARLAASLRNLGMVRFEMSDYRGAVPPLRRALALAEQAWGETHPDTLVLALELLEAEAYSVGTTWGNERAEQIDARIASALGADHPLRLRSQFFLFTHTIDIAAALARAEREYGPHSPGLADARFYAFLSRAQQGNDRRAVAEAREIATRAREDLARLLGPEHPRFADALSYSAQMLWFGGFLEEGLAFEEQAAAIWRSTMGEEHVFSALELMNLGIYRSSLGDDIGAREIYPLALDRLERQLGSGNAWVSLCKMYLGKLLAREGDVVEAERWLRRAVIGFRSSPHPHRGNTAIAEAELAGLLVEKGALEEAALLLSRAEALIRAWDEIHTMVLLEVTLARLHLAQGDEGAARGDLLRLLDYLERKEMLDHPSAAEALALLARLDQISGRPADAVPRSRSALDLRERVLGPNHPLVAESLVQLAELELAAGDPAAALADAVRGEEVSRRHLELWSRALGDSEVMLYVARRVSGVDLALSAARRGGPRQIAAAWDALVRSRALVLDRLARRQAIVHGAEDPAVARGVAAVERARAQLARLLVRGPEGEEPARYEDRLDYVRRQRESAEAALARVSEEALRDLDFPTAGFEEVRAALPADAGLVAFHRQAASTAGGSPARYFAFVLAGPASAPELVELPPAAEIEARVAALHAEIARAARDPRRAAALEPGFRAAAAELRRQVWDPLASRFARARRVFVVPAGSLASVPFAALPDDETGYLLEVGPEIHFLSAERDLAAGSPARPGAGLLALGAPDFDAPPDGATSGQTGAGRPPAAAAPGGAALRGTPAVRCASLAELKFPALPGSVEEVLEVGGAWSRSRHATAPGAEPLLELTGAAATEGALTRGIRGRRIVHLATHGFALGAACAGEGPASGPSGRVNPLVLSGLAVAGANRRLEPSRAGDDGILTSEEVAGLDLRGVEWVVLSGCDTGAGDVERFEGVIGLRRSFRMAGARTLVFSLWPVEDRAAAQWMRDLYAARFAEGLETPAAVRQASLRNLDRRRRNGESTHPFFWAAFVAEGDWR